ncbi:unnamed protein product [Clavelina lepadiformis]|uniref:Uncharacterized protein n=1 Tax=Clavelina lepadiformis TaxID=159417 RepID=A0ABP0FE17_CLALP
MTYENFCDELKAKSSAIHEKSDRLVQLKLAVILTDTKLYSKVLGDFFCIFKAIEDGVQNNIDHKYLTDLWIPALLRADKFVQDLEYYSGLGWRDMLKPSAAALKYVSRIETLANEEPALLVAYVHTMYLGK